MAVSGGRKTLDLVIQEPREGTGRCNSHGLGRHPWAGVCPVGGWGSGACSPAQLLVWTLGLEVDSTYVCMPYGHYCVCMKPLCFPLGEVPLSIPVHLLGLFSASFVQFPLCLPSYPDCGLNDIPKGRSL